MFQVSFDSITFSIGRLGKNSESSVSYSNPRQSYQSALRRDDRIDDALFRRRCLKGLGRIRCRHTTDDFARNLCHRRRRLGSKLFSGSRGLNGRSRPGRRNRSKFPSGDVHFADVLAQMGADVVYADNAVEVSRKPGTTLRGISIDCLAIPDAAMTFVPMALCTQGAVELTGIASWRVKETDRLEAMVCEMRKFGARVSSGPDWIRLERGSEVTAARVATYSDHRMAMSFALAACAGIPVQIENPACTAKTFPDFSKHSLR